MNIINEKVVAYIDNLYKPLNNDLENLRKYAEENNIPIILKDTENHILSMLEIKKPKKILEIGTAIGYSACCFAKVLPECEIITIEYNEKMKQEAEKNISDMNFSNRINVVLGDATSILEEFDRNLDFDFVFIDAGKSHYKIFFQEALKLCKRDALIISDNVLMQGRTVSEEYDPHKKHKTNIKQMREYIEYITNLKNVKSFILPVGDGLAISIIGGNNE